MTDMHVSHRPGPARSWAVMLVIAALGCSGSEQDEFAGNSGPEARPSYTIRLDSQSSDMAEFRLVEDDDGIRIDTGPAGIAYRADDVVTRGDYVLRAKFVLYDAPVGYREAYGLFFGGLDLDTEEQEYVYLLVRSTGEFLIKRRLGSTTETLIDWRAHPAIRGVEAEGDQPENILGVEVLGRETVFLINDEEVHTFRSSRVRPQGTAGVRVNHRLDVRVDEWVLETYDDVAPPVAH